MGAKRVYLNEDQPWVDWLDTPDLKYAVENQRPILETATMMQRAPWELIRKARELGLMWIETPHTR